MQRLLQGFLSADQHRQQLQRGPTEAALASYSLPLLQANRLGRVAKTQLRRFNIFYFQQL